MEYKKRDFCAICGNPELTINYLYTLTKSSLR